MWSKRSVLGGSPKHTRCFQPRHLGKKNGKSNQHRTIGKIEFKKKKMKKRKRGGDGRKGFFFFSDREFFCWGGYFIDIMHTILIFVKNWARQPSMKSHDRKVLRPIVSKGADWGGWGGSGPHEQPCAANLWIGSGGPRLGRILGNPFGPPPPFSFLFFLLSQLSHSRSYWPLIALDWAHVGCLFSRRG